MKTDHDEIIIQEAFKSMNIPNTDMATAVHEKLAQKPKRPFKKTIAIALAAMLILATSIATVATDLGSFTRLTRILGEDNAANLIPIASEGTNSELITPCGMRVEVVAIGLGGLSVDVYIKLEDLTANRLQNDIILEATLYMNDHEHRAVMRPQIIDRCETGIITFHVRNWFETAGGSGIGQITVAIHSIHYNGVQYWWEQGIPANGIPLGVDFSNLPVSPETIFVSHVYNTGFDENIETHIQTSQHTMVGWYATDSAGNIPPFPNMAWPDGTYIIAPGQTNYEITIDSRIRSSISSVGMVDGTLRVLRRYDALSQPGRTGELGSNNNSSRLFLHRQGPHPREVHEVFAIERTSFVMYNDMVVQCFPFSSPYSWGHVDGANYVEYRFLVNESRLEYYRIAGLFNVYSVLDINWYVTVDVIDEPHRYLKAEGLFPFSDNAVFTEVAVYSWGVLFTEATGDNWAEGWLDGRNSIDVTQVSATLYTTNGTIPLRFPLVGFFADGEDNHRLYMIFLKSHIMSGDNIILLDIDLDAVVAISVGDEVVYFTGQ